MNRKQKIIWIGIAVVVLMCIFPPWTRVVEIGGDRTIWPAGYHFLLAPPKPIFPIENLITKDAKGYLGRDVGRDYTRIDFARLIVQCVIVSLITGGLLYTVRIKESNRE